MKELSAIQSELKVPKNQTNKFGGYQYRSCEDILEKVKPLLSKYECSLIIDDKIVAIEKRIYVEATAKLMNSENVVVHVSGYAREPEEKKGMDPAQITGATSSYARKYALNGLFAIDDTKDPDATNKHDRDSDKKPQPKPKKKEPTTQEKFNRAKMELFKRVKELRSGCTSDLDDVRFMQIACKDVLNKTQAVNINDVRALWLEIVDGSFDLNTGERIPEELK